MQIALFGANTQGKRFCLGAASIAAGESPNWTCFKGGAGHFYADFTLSTGDEGGDFISHERLLNARGLPAEYEMGS